MTDINIEELTDNQIKLLMKSAKKSLSLKRANFILEKIYSFSNIERKNRILIDLFDIGAEYISNTMESLQDEKIELEQSRYSLEREIDISKIDNLLSKIDNLLDLE